MRRLHHLNIDEGDHINRTPDNDEPITPPALQPTPGPPVPTPTKQLPAIDRDGPTQPGGAVGARSRAPAAIRRGERSVRARLSE